MARPTNYIQVKDRYGKVTVTRGTLSECNAVFDRSRADATTVRIIMFERVGNRWEEYYNGNY